MENKVKQLLQQVHSHMTTELKINCENHYNDLREHGRVSSVVEARMETRVRNMIQEAQEERLIESRRQTEATHAVEAKLERARAELNTEVRQLKERLDELEEKLPVPGLQLQSRGSGNLRDSGNDLVPGILRHMNVLARQHQHDQKKRSDHIEQCIQAEPRRAVHVASSSNNVPVPSLSQTHN